MQRFSPGMNTRRAYDEGWACDKCAESGQKVLS